VINIENNIVDLNFFNKVIKEIKNNDKIKSKKIIESFSPNQFQCKIKLIELLDNINVINEKTNIAVFGCWFNSILGSVLSKRVNKIVGYDMDEYTITLGKRLFKDHKNVEFVHCDVFKEYKNNISFDIIINTSCEHMPPMKDWPYWNHIKPGTIFAFQSNNMHWEDEHTNCVYSLQQFEKQLPSSFEVIAKDETIIDKQTAWEYIRYTLIGRTNV